MSKYKNEQGAALILTMFIITILLLFVSAQLFQVTNTRKQVSTMEKNIMAEHMAEMGIDYYYALLDSEFDIESNSFDDFTEVAPTIPTEVASKKRDFPNDKGNRSYNVKVKERENDPYTFEVRSTGEAFGVVKIIERKIIITEY